MHAHVHTQTHNQRLVYMCKQQRIHTCKHMCVRYIYRYITTYIQSNGTTQTHLLFSHQCMLQCHSLCYLEIRPTGFPSFTASSCALWTNGDLAGGFGACCLALAGKALYTKSVPGSRVNAFHIKPVSSCSTTQHSTNMATQIHQI